MSKMKKEMPKRHAWTTSTYVPGVGIIEVKDDLIDYSQVIVTIAPPAVKISDLPELIGVYEPERKS